MKETLTQAEKIQMGYTCVKPAAKLRSDNQAQRPREGLKLIS